MMYSSRIVSLLVVLILVSKVQAESTVNQGGQTQSVRHSLIRAGGFGVSLSGGGLRFQPDLMPTALKPGAKPDSFYKSDLKPDTSSAVIAAASPAVDNSDVTPPVVKMVSPVEGSTVSGKVDLTAQASDDRGVAKVEFYFDGAGPSISTSAANPYFSVLDSTRVFNGAHTLTAVAYDFSGNQSSQTIAIFVFNAPPFRAAPFSALDNSDRPPTEMELGEIFAFPNPARGNNVTIHVEAGLAEQVQIRIYDEVGSLIHQAEMFGDPTKGVNNRWSYEYRWDTTGIPPGAYLYAVQATHSRKTVRTLNKFAIVK